MGIPSATKDGRRVPTVQDFENPVGGDLDDCASPNWPQPLADKGSGRREHLGSARPPQMGEDGAVTGGVIVGAGVVIAGAAT